MNFNDVSPDEFIKTIVYTTHNDYASARKFGKKWRIMKLVIKLSEDLDYEGISSGLYKHGHYSFYVDSTFWKIGLKSSLHGVKIKQSDINRDLSEHIKPLINDYQKIIISKTKDFSKWAHFERIPDQYQDFYRFGDPLLQKIQDLSKEQKKDNISEYYEKISDLITNFDNYLNHVDSKHIKQYFEYVDLLENLLLVCNKRQFNFRIVKPLLKEMGNTYYSGIYSFLPPFELTLDSKESSSFEKNSYNEAIKRSEKIVNDSLPKLTVRILENNLKPTLEELDEEIKLEFKKSDEDTRKEFINIMNQRIC